MLLCHIKIRILKSQSIGPVVDQQSVSCRKDIGSNLTTARLLLSGAWARPLTFVAQTVYCNYCKSLVRMGMEMDEHQSDDVCLHSGDGVRNTSKWEKRNYSESHEINSNHSKLVTMATLRKSWKYWSRLKKPKPGDKKRSEGVESCVCIPTEVQPVTLNTW